MAEFWIRAGLRLVAVLVAFYGATAIASTVILWVSSWFFRLPAGLQTTIALPTALVSATPIFVAIVFWKLSARIAQAVVEEPKTVSVGRSRR